MRNEIAKLVLGRNVKKQASQAIDIAASAFVLAFLLFYFGRFIQANGWDLVQHFMLVDELMKHSGVSAGAADRIGPMAFYPPAAHWLAAMIGSINGSGLVGITLVSIAATYGCYLIITALAGSASWFAQILFVGLFFLLAKTRALMGWEVVGNFFYPQLVADLAYLTALFLISKGSRAGTAVLVTLGFGLCTMWIQPLIAVHILAVGCVLVAVQALDASWNGRQGGILFPLLQLGCMVSGAAVIVLFHPALQAMRTISANDGTLEFGFQNLIAMAAILAFAGILNVWQYLNRRAAFVDAVLGSAIIAAVGLAALQFAMLRLFGEGSLYAVKKHFFIIVTVGAINLVRLAAHIPYLEKRIVRGVPLVIPVAAGIMTFVILNNFNTPAKPFLDALDYANRVRQQLGSDFVPGSTVYDSNTRPLIESVMVSVTAFEHPFDKTAKAWLLGAPIKKSARFVMTARTPELEAQCPDRAAEDGAYMVVQTACLKRYRLGQTIRFGAGGNGWAYAQDGWSVPSAAGVWTRGELGASLTLEITEPIRSGNYRLSVDGLAYLGPRHPVQMVDVEVNGTLVAEWRFDLEQPAGWRTAAIPHDLLAGGSASIVFRSPGSTSPAAVGDSSDTRILGIGIKAMILTADRL